VASGLAAGSARHADFDRRLDSKLGCSTSIRGDGRWLSLRRLGLGLPVGK
jgi:hypothetical protein